MASGAFYDPIPAGWESGLPTLGLKSDPAPIKVTAALAVQRFHPTTQKISRQVRNMKIQLNHLLMSVVMAASGLAGGNACQAALPSAAEVVSSSAKPLPVAHLQVLASVGPLEYLSGANVVVKDAHGKLIARGKTNAHGSTFFHLRKSKLAYLPLRISTSGGQINQGGKQTSGPAFVGHLKGQIDTVPTGKHSIAWLDLLSTTASVMRTKTRSYASATEAVRASLGMGKGFPANGLRFRNNHVEWALLQAATQSKGGYDRYVRDIASRANKGQKITELSLPKNTILGPRAKTAPRDVITDALRPGTPQVLTAQASTSDSTSTYPQCTPPVGNGSSNSMSTEVIEDVGVTSIKYLLQYAGVPSSAASGVAGMLLTGGATGSPADSAIAAVSDQLACISAQLTYLTEQVQELQLTQDVDQNTSCSNSVTNNYYVYVGVVEDAADCTTSTCQLNGNNPSLVGDLQSWSQSSSMVNGDCGDTVSTNSMLFGTSGGQASAWQQLNKNYQSTAGGYAWYTAAQVQQLQQFLSYWGTIAYDLFVLTNEYYNYYQQFENAQISAGNVSGSSTLCSNSTAEPTTADTPTFCVLQSNIMNAYPPDLYSDEIGMWNGEGAGLAVNAYPAGLAMHNPLDNPTQPIGQQTALSPLYIYNTSGNNSYWSANATSGTNTAESYYGATPPSYSAFNSGILNPAALPSAIEQFSNPQAWRTLQPTSSQVAVLTANNYSQGAGSPGTTSWQFFVDAINQESWQECTYSIDSEGQTTQTCNPEPYAFPIASQWQPLTASNSTTNGTGFFTADNVSQLSTYTVDGSYCNGNAGECMTTSIHFNNTIGQYVYSYTNPDNTKSEPHAPSNYPVFGALLGRTWWPAYTTNNPPSSYNPPPPPVCTVIPPAVQCN